MWLCNAPWIMRGRLVEKASPDKARCSRGREQVNSLCCLQWGPRWTEQNTDLSWGTGLVACSAKFILLWDICQEGAPMSRMIS